MIKDAFKDVNVQKSEHLEDCIMLIKAREKEVDKSRIVKLTNRINACWDKLSEKEKIYCLESLGFDKTLTAWKTFGGNLTWVV